MRNALFVIGTLLVAIGVIAAAGLLKYDDKETMDIGRLELAATQEKKAPVNWGYVMIGGGALLLIGGAVARKKS